LGTKQKCNFRQIMLKVRKGEENDVNKVFELVMELAVFEQGENEVINTPNKMRQEAFGENPSFWFFVAEKDGEIVGTSIFYIRYSTWKGSTLYLEDIVVTKKERGKGVGTYLFEKTLEYAKSKDYPRMSWQVLDWNTKAIGFYKKFSTEFDSQWINCHLDVVSS